MKHKIPLQQTEVEQIKKECKLQGLDYDTLPIKVNIDINGNIINITNGESEHFEITHIKTINKKKIFKNILVLAVPPNLKFKSILKSHGIE